jgi:glutaredoxin
MKQQCHVSFVYLSWLILACGMIFYLFRGNYLQAGLWVFFVALFLWLYVRNFPSLSKLMGYGSVADHPATEVIRTPGSVALYTGLGCPFCPLVRKRLKELQARMGFELREVDVTFKPDVLISKGIHALPVVEVGEGLWVGNATSEELAKFIAEHAGAAAHTAPA